MEMRGRMRGLEDENLLVLPPQENITLIKKAMQAKAMQAIATALLASVVLSNLPKTSALRRCPRLLIR